MKKIYNIKVNGKVYEVELEKVSEVSGNVTSNKTVSAPVEVEAKSSGNSTEIKAPMPGVVFNIPVTVGQEVTKGQVVCVIEAMKMETEILSDVDGKITSIQKEKGTNVVLGDCILTIN